MNLLDELEATLIQQKPLDIVYLRRKFISLIDDPSFLTKFSVTRFIKIINTHLSSLNSVAGPLAMIAGYIVEEGGNVEKEASLEFAKFISIVVVNTKLSFENKIYHPSMDILNVLAEPSAVFLSAHKEARTAIRNDKNLIEAINYLRFSSPTSKMLHMLLEVLDDEELIVLIPNEKRAFSFTISSIAENSQLQILLADKLCNLLNLEKIDEEIIMTLTGDGPQQINKHMHGFWNMYNWLALGKDGKIRDEEDSDYWVWNEGTPSDITKFRGKRILLLGPQSYMRYFNCCRIFAPLKANVIFHKELQRDEVDNLINEILSANEKEIEEATKFMLSRIGK